MFDVAWAQAPGGGGQAPPSLLVNLIPFVLIFVIFYFLLIRPQVRRQKALAQMVEGLSKGDRVVTNGGILGDVVGKKDDVIVLRIADETKVEVLKSAIASVRGKSNG